MSDRLSPLTQEQQDCIQRQGHLVRNCLRATNDFKFMIGVFLIKRTKDYNSDTGKYSWVMEKFSKTRDVPRKYKVVAVDEYGIPFLKKVLYNGKLHKDMVYLGNQDCTYVHYEVDPDMQFHVILGEDEKTFDPQTTYNQERYGGKHGKTKRS